MLVSITVVLKMSIGFLLFLPSPKIEYSTVFSAIKIFSELFEQLKQDTLPHFCHDGVFKIVVDIFFPEESPILKFYTNVW